MKRAKKKKYYRYRRRGYNLEFEQIDEHGFWSKLNCRQVKAVIRASDIVFDRQYKKPEWAVTPPPLLILAEGTLLRPVRSMELPIGTKVMLWAY